MRAAGNSGRGCACHAFFVPHVATSILTRISPAVVPSSAHHAAGKEERAVQQAWDDTVENINEFGRAVGSRVEDLGRTIAKHADDVGKAVDRAVDQSLEAVAPTGRKFNVLARTLSTSWS